VIDTFMGWKTSTATMAGDTLARPAKVENLNYPSVMVPHVYPSGEPHTVMRSVRNVGAMPTAYDVYVR
jgi:hypothetical protein